MNKNEQRINEAMYEVEDEEDLEEQMEKIWDAYLDDKLDTGLVAFVMRHPSATVEMRYGLMKRYGALVLQAMNWSEEYLLQQKNEAEKMMRQIIKDPKTDEYRLNDIYFWGYAAKPTPEELFELLLHPQMDGEILFYHLNERTDNADVVVTLIQKGAMMNSSVILERLSEKIRENFNDWTVDEREKILSEAKPKKDDFSTKNLWKKAFWKYIPHNVY